MPEFSTAVEGALQELATRSIVAHREARHVLPALRPHGEQAMLRWLAAVGRLFEHSREAGLAFVRGAREAEKISEAVLPWTEQALAFVRWPASAPALEGFMKNLPRAFGSLGQAGEQRWADIGFAWYARDPESGRAYFTTPVVELSAGQGITGIEHLCAPIEELYAARKLALATCLAGAIRVRNLLGAQAIQAWAARGVDIMQSGRARGEAYFRLESEESLAVLLDHLPGFRVGDRNRLLALLLDVWYEREFDLKESSWSPEKGRPFVETDGRTLFLPAVMPDRDEAILGALHAAGRQVFGTFDRHSLRRMCAEAGVEFPKSGQMTWGPLFAPYGDDLLRFQLLFDACEGLRVDARIQTVIPNYLRRLAATGESHRQRPVGALPHYDWALAGVAAAAAGDLATLDARLQPLVEAGATIADSYRIAGVIYRDSKLPGVAELEVFQASYLPGRSPNAARAAFAQADPEEAQKKEGGSEGQQEAKDGGEQEDVQEEGAEASGQPDSSLQQEISGESKSAGARMQSRAQSQAPQAPGSGGDKGVPYPEWDYREGRYKHNWSWVQEKPLAEANLAEANRLTSQYAAALKRLKRAIEAQKPTRLAPKIRQWDGDDFDLNATVSYVAERYAGMSPSPAIYRRREIRQREVAVTLLADMSTSIMQHLPEGGGRLVDRVRAGVLLFAESMEEVGDAYSIAGFCSKYRDNVSYYMIKDFNEPYTQQTKAVIGGMSGRLATRMGAAIRHATARFTGVETRRRLLLILSDGRPEDYDDGGDRRYLHEDTRMAVKEAALRGVHAFCVTVDTMANQYLPQIFGPGHYLVLDQINNLPNKLPEIYLRLRR